MTTLKTRTVKEKVVQVVYSLDDPWDQLTEAQRRKAIKTTLKKLGDAIVDAPEDYEIQYVSVHPDYEKSISGEGVVRKIPAYRRKST